MRFPLEECAGGVRDITRAIEHQITDSVIDAKTQGATLIRLRAGGALVHAEIVTANPPASEACVAGKELVA